MADIPTVDSPVFGPPRISYTRFRELLKSRNSPAVPEALVVYNELVNAGIDVAFALAQFRVESQYGTAGFAKVTGSWGNTLWDEFLCVNASGKMTFTTSDGTKWTYATYTNYHNAILDYIRVHQWYRDRYNLISIYDACGRWLGPRDADSAGHIKYVNIVIDDMINYEYPEGGYESGDSMIYAGPSLDKSSGRLTLKYPITVGLNLYRGTETNSEGQPVGVLKKYNGTPGNAWWLGWVNGGKTWGSVFIGTSAADTDATLVYLYKPDPAKIIKV